jgi:hypothetical protein
VRPSRRIAATIPLAALALVLPLTGCGDESADMSESAQPAPSASDFPAPDGRTLEQIVSDAGATQELVISPSGQVFREGQNRFGFGVFSVDREQITDAEVAIYAAPASGGPAEGPFPARVESTETDPAFEAQTTASDPDAAQAVYVSELEFTRQGPWNLVGLIRQGDSYAAARIPSVKVGDYPQIPESGDKAPVVHTPTVEDVGGDLSKIDTREPHDTQHTDDLADVIGKEPVVLLFATPRLCVSRVCGPVVDIAEQVKSEHEDEAAFIHMEIYEDNSVDKGLRPQVESYGLPTEPWLFVIDADGRVSTAIEGAFSLGELEAALEKATAGDSAA